MTCFLCFAATKLPRNSKKIMLLTELSYLHAKQTPKILLETYFKVNTPVTIVKDSDSSIQIKLLQNIAKNKFLGINPGTK